MLNQEAHNLVRRWIEKGRRCNPKKLDGAFDRFFSYFVAYNALYSISDRKLRATGHTYNTQASDKKAAIEGVTIYLGADRLWRHLTEYSKSDIEALRIGLLNEQYAVSFNKTTGEIDILKDKELATQLESDNDEQKCYALLQILYSSRNNMFHGNKMPTHIQIQPLGYLSSTLGVVTELLSSSLHANV